MSDWAVVALVAIGAAFLLGVIWIAHNTDPDEPPQRTHRDPDWMTYRYERGIQPTEYKAPPPPPKTPGGIGTPSKEAPGDH